MSAPAFSGSYAAEDVTFLLKQVELAPTDVEQKERLIQSGQRHYSEMIAAEHPPSAEYLELFERALRLGSNRFAADLARLAKALAQRPTSEVVIVSLARAGTPVGVLLRRALTHLGRRTVHYSISIIRDRGIDAVALDHILSRHPAESLVFVDGWTGKGAIATELRAALADYRASRRVQLDDGLVVVADLAGVASVAATADDYLIPSSILNAVVSGLVSRTILNQQLVKSGDFHACVYYRSLEAHDRSRAFVDDLTPALETALADADIVPPLWDDARRATLRAVSESFVALTMARYRVADRNRVKPGIGEATRALLRRLPERLIVQEPGAADVVHLEHLARTRRVAVEHDPAIPYRAATIIQTLGEG